MNNLDLIEQLEDLKYHCQDFAEDEMEKDIQPFTDDVKALDQAINELRWIPVEEKLPSENGHYLITLKSGRVDISVFSVRQEKWAFFKNSYIIAWKPLPKPYEKK